MTELDEIADSAASGWANESFAAAWFIEGFKKARDMAKYIALQNSHAILCKPGKCDSYRHICETVHKISEMGEKEV